MIDELGDPVRKGCFPSCAIRTVCLRMIGGPQEGQWLDVPPGSPVQGYSLDWGQTTAEGHRVVPGPYLPVKMHTFVPTGALDWREDDCAEIWVPEDRLAEWQTEHDCEAL